MSVDPNTQTQTAPGAVTTPAAELNFRKQQQMYERMIAEKEARIAELQQQRQNPQDEDEDSDDPYVDKRKLTKTLSKFEQKNKQETKQDIQAEISKVIAEERRNAWLENNSDFNEVMAHAEKFAQKAPLIAKSILAMPESFERQKLVYETIKTMGINQPEVPQQSMQQKVDANRRSPYYQPSGVGAAPYASQSDFSPAGQKQAYDKVMELKRNLRLG